MEFFIFVRRARQLYKIIAEQTLRLCLVLGKCERKKIVRKSGRKEKAKEMNIIFSLVWLSMENSREKKRIHFLLFG